MKKLIRHIEAIAGGAIVSACLFAAIGGIGGHGTEGAIAGSVLGAIVGYCAYAGQIHRITIGAILYALFGCLIGPGVDDYGGVGALFFFAPLGALIGWLGWRFMLALPVGFAVLIIVGSLLIPAPEHQLFVILSFGVGVILGVYVGSKLERHFDAIPGVWPPHFLTEPNADQ